MKLRVLNYINKVYYFYIIIRSKVLSKNNINILYYYKIRFAQILNLYKSLNLSYV